MDSHALISLPLSRMTGGLNRFEKEAGPDQFVDGLDVIDDDGDLRRRDGFVTLAVGPPHMLPAGTLRVFGSVNDPSTAADMTTIDDGAGGRISVGGPGNIGQYYGMYFGSDVIFDGIDLRGTTWAGAGPAGARHLSGRYFNLNLSWPYTGTPDSVSAAIPYLFDSSFSFGSNNDYGGSMLRDGIIAWHRSQLVGWKPVSLAGLSKYWVLLRWVNPAGVAATLGVTVTWVRPGPRPFVLEPVNGIFPARLRGETRHFVFGADRKSAVSSANRGAMLGDHRSSVQERTTELVLLEDEGAAVFDVQAWPQWQQRTGDPDTWADSGVSGGNLGTTGMLEKLRRDYVWSKNQWLGGAVRDGLATAVLGQTTTNVRLASALGGIADHALRGFRLYCSARTAGGPAVGEIREIVDNVGADFTVYNALSAAADVNNVFSILWPSARVYLSTTDDDQYEAEANAEGHDLALTNSLGAIVQNRAVTYERNLADKVPAPHNYFRAGHALRYTFDAGERWSAIRDNTSGRLLLTNGRSGILAYDGRSLRRLEATSNPALDDSVALYLGVLADEASLNVGQDPRVFALSQLRIAPPTGRYLADFSGHIVVAGIDGRPHDIEWSAPGASNRIWPYLYYATARDSTNNPITGMATLYDRLVVFTSASLFEGAQPDYMGRIALRPIGQGIGFSSHFAVQRIAVQTADGQRQALIGPNAEGLALYMGGQPSFVIPDWRTVFDGGVNAELLGRAVSTTYKQRNWYLCALARSGASTNDRILVYDWGARKAWLWTAPFGVSFLATDHDEAGRERVLIGTDDGFVQTILNAPDDDGTAVNAFALSVPTQPAGGRELALAALELTLKSLGATETMNVQVEINRAKGALSVAGGTAPVAADVRVDRGESRMDTSSFVWPVEAVPVPEPAGTPHFSDDGMKTARFNMPHGTMAHQVQLRVGGSSRWRLRAAEMLARPRSRRGR